MKLGKGSLLRVEPVQGTVVEVSQGEVWITQHRDHTDYLIAAGEVFVLDGKGAAVISALKDPAVRVLQPARFGGVWWGALARA